VTPQQKQEEQEGQEEERQQEMQQQQRWKWSRERGETSQRGRVEAAGAEVEPWRRTRRRELRWAWGAAAEGSSWWADAEGRRERAIGGYLSRSLSLDGAW
jgi:hypothetical protein